MYDDAFFMFLKTGICREECINSTKPFIPKVSVVHTYESGANKSKKLFMIFISSAVTTLINGVGFDSERKTINSEALSQFK
jgi:hypothetical protein